MYWPNTPTDKSVKENPKTIKLTKVPNPAKGTPWVNQTTVKNRVESTEKMLRIMPKNEMYISGFDVCDSIAFIDQLIIFPNLFHFHLVLNCLFYLFLLLKFNLFKLFQLFFDNCWFIYTWVRYLTFFSFTIRTPYTFTLLVNNLLSFFTKKLNSL